MMRAKWVLSLIVVSGVSLIFALNSRAAFTLTDKNNANPMTFTSSASSTYIMETQYSQPFQPSTPGATAGFRFNDTDGANTLLTTPNAGADLRQGTVQSLAGNANNGYVGTVVGKAWGNTLTMSLGSLLLINGPGADLYITAKNVIGGVVQSISTQNKSFEIGFHVTNQGSLNGWHLYNVAALPTNFQPAQGTGNVLGALDLSNLKFGSGANDSAASLALLPTIPLGTLIDKVILVNSNSANDWAFGFLGNNSEAPTGFVARRDFDNADADGNGFTGVDYLTGRYGPRDTNGQDAPQAWFLGLNNTVSAVPEPSAFLVGLLECGVVGLVFAGRRLLGFGVASA